MRQKLLLIVLTYIISISAVFGQAVFESRQSGEWNDPNTWNIISGSDVGGVPDGNDDIIIRDGDVVNLGGTGRICDLLVINFGGELVFNSNELTFTLAYSDAASVSAGQVTGGTPLLISRPNQSDGKWNTKGNFYNNDAPSLNGSGTKTTPEDVYINSFFDANFPDIFAGQIMISSEGSLVLDAAAEFQNFLLVEGGLSNIADVTLNGDFEIGGNGSIDVGANDMLIANGASITVRSGSDLSITAATIGGNTGTTLTNNDGLTLNGDLDVDNFTAGVGAKTITSGTIDVGVSLDLSATDNTFQFAQSAAISAPVTTTYFNVTITAADVVTIGDGTDINGKIEMIGPTTFVGTVSIAGDFDHFAGAATYTGSTIVFDGTTNQTAQSSVDDPIPFNNLTVSKTSGDMNFISGNVHVANTLDLDRGIVQMNGDTLIVGENATQTGTLDYFVGTVNGTIKKWFAVGNPALEVVPITSNSFENGVTISVDFSNITTGGTVSFGFTETAPGSAGLPIDVPATNGETIYNTFSEGYWTIVGGNGFDLSGSTYNVSVFAGDFTSFTVDATNRLLVKSTASTDWTTGGQADTGGPYADGSVVNASGITTLPAINISVGSAINCTAVDADAISGATAVCTNDAADIYTTTQVAGTGTSTFRWTVVGGLINLDGGGTATTVDTTLAAVDVTWGGTGQVGSVTVAEQAENCGFGAPSTLSVAIGSIPAEGITGRTEVAENSTGFTYSVDNPLPGYTYSWDVDQGTFNPPINTGTSVTVDWGSNGTGSISVTAEDTSNGCGPSGDVVETVTIYRIIDTDSDGSWADGPGPASRWETGNNPSGTESARINDLIDLDAPATIGNLVITSGGSLALGGQTLTVGGELVINGPVTGAGTIILNGANSRLSGSYLPTIGTGITIQFNSTYTVESGTALDINGNISLQNSATVTNNGSVTLSGDLTLTGSNTWTQGQGSTTENTNLFIGGTITTNGGTFNASALYNTVEYGGTGAQTVITPSSNYHSITLSGGGTKTFPLNIIIEGNLTLTAPATPDFTTNTTQILLQDTVSQTIDFSGMSVTTAGSTSDPLYGLLLNKSAGNVTLASNLDISNDLVLANGNIVTGANTLTLLNRASGAISAYGSGSYIDGILARLTDNTGTAGTQIYVFPVGKTRYKRVDLRTTDATGSTFQVEAFETSAKSFGETYNGAIVRVSDVSYWDISRTTGTDNAVVRLYWDDAAAEGITSAADLLVAHFNGASWDDLGGVSGANYVETNVAFGSFSPFSFASSLEAQNPLPVELLEFNGTYDKGEIELNWSTSSEVNNEIFSLFHSTDGKEFNLIHQVAGAGNSNELNNYSFTHTNYQEGFNYYQLQQRDFDGTTETFQIISVVAGELDKNDIVFYPNPVSPGQRITLGNSSLQNAIVTLINNAGVKVTDLYPENGSYKIPSELTSGIYYLLISVNDDTISTRFIVK